MTHARILGETEGAHPVPGCEALPLDLDALWAEIDRLDPGESSAR
jgi:hypothetical protein